MKIERKKFELKIEAGSVADGMIRGFASTFGNEDQGYDIVEAGAFRQTIKSNKGRFPILADHDPSKQIGWNIRAEETDHGLYVEGKLNMKDPLAVARHQLAMDALELGAKMGLSIGYSVVKWENDKERPMVRRLKELKLWEYSMVTFPMNVEAMVTDAKQAIIDLVDQDWVTGIREEMIRRGFTPDQLLKALGELQAANTVSDPGRMAQSLDRAIKLIKGET